MKNGKYLLITNEAIHANTKDNIVTMIVMAYILSGKNRWAIVPVNAGNTPERK